MAKRDPRILKNQAAVALDKGKHKKALKIYLELEKAEPFDGQWPRRAGEMYRRLGKKGLAISALDRAVDKYVRAGFLVKAIASCKMILQIDPDHGGVKERLAGLNAERGIPEGKASLAEEAREAAETGIPAPGQGQDPGQMPGQSPGQSHDRDDELHSSTRPPGEFHEPMGPPGPSRDTTRPLDPSRDITRPPDPFRDSTRPPDALRDSTRPPEEWTDRTPPPGPQRVHSAPPRPGAVPPPIPKGPRGAGSKPSHSRQSLQQAASQRVTVAASQKEAAKRTGSAVDTITDPEAASFIQDPRLQPNPVPAPELDLELGFYSAAPPSPTPLDTEPENIGVTDTWPDPYNPLLDQLEQRALDAQASQPAQPSAPEPHHAELEQSAAQAPGAPTSPGTRTQPEGKGVARRAGRSKRRTIPPNAPLEAVQLGDVVPGARRELDDKGEDSGIIEIPIDEPEDILPSTHLTFEAERALRQTPLLSSLGPDAMQRLVQEVRLLSLFPGEILFREGEHGHTLYIIAEGGMTLYSEGPPRTTLVQLGENDFFGEIALVTDHVRHATAAADMERGAQLLAIDRNVMGDLVEEEPAVLQALLRFFRNRLVRSLVETSPLFAPFVGDERHQLASRFRFLEVNVGAVLLEQNQRSSGLFVLLSGRLEAIRSDEAGSRRLGTLGPGGLCGEMSLLANEPSLFTVRATTKSFILQLPEADFREIIMTHPQVLVFVSDLAEERRRRFEAIIAGNADYDAGRITLV